MARKKKGAGGKLNRSEIVQTRLDQRLRYAAELLARKQRRTLSSLIEHLVEEACKRETVDILPLDADTPYNRTDYKTVTIAEAMHSIWHTEEHLRFVAFASCLPHLLTHGEEVLWSYIRTRRYFWSHYRTVIEDEKGKFIDHDWDMVNNFKGLIPEHLKEYWEKITSGHFDIDVVPNKIGKEVTRPKTMPHYKRILNTQGGKIEPEWVREPWQTVEVKDDKKKKKKHGKTKI